VFLIKAFGGEAGWAGPESPIDENDESITHHVCDRPVQKHRFLAVSYVQPQWVYDCANFRVLIPTSAYVPGVKPPPHVSPFVNDEEEGYVPDYALKLKELQVRVFSRSLSSARMVLRFPPVSHPRPHACSPQYIHSSSHSFVCALSALRMESIPLPLSAPKGRKKGGAEQFRGLGLDAVKPKPSVCGVSGESWQSCGGTHDVSIHTHAHTQHTHSTHIHTPLSLPLSPSPASRKQ